MSPRARSYRTLSKPLPNLFSPNGIHEQGTDDYNYYTRTAGAFKDDGAGG